VVLAGQALDQDVLAAAAVVLVVIRKLAVMAQAHVAAAAAAAEVLEYLGEPLEVVARPASGVLAALAEHLVAVELMADLVEPMAAAAVVHLAEQELMVPFVLFGPEQVDNFLQHVWGIHNGTVYSN
jgi:hypothetical protein